MSGPVVEEPGGEAPRVGPVASRKLSSKDASAHVCPRVDVDPESGDAVYHPMCCGRVPARRWQLGICCFGPGGCTLFCSSVCLQGVASHAALSVVTWVGCAMAPVGLCLAMTSNSEAGAWRETDSDDRVIVQETHAYLDRPPLWTHRPGDRRVPALVRACGAEDAWRRFLGDLDASSRALHAWTRWRLPLLSAPALGLLALVVFRASVLVVVGMLLSFAVGVCGTYVLRQMVADHRRKLVDAWHPAFERAGVHVFVKEHAVGGGKQMRTYTWIELNRLGTLSETAGRVLHSPFLNSGDVEAVPAAAASAQPVPFAHAHVVDVTPPRRKAPTSLRVHPGPGGENRPAAAARYATTAPPEI